MQAEAGRMYAETERMYAEVERMYVECKKMPDAHTVLPVLRGLGTCTQQ